MYKKNYTPRGFNLIIWPAAAAKLLQSCLTLCDPTDGSPPGSHSWDSPGKNMEWVAISFSSAWKWKMKVKLLSRVRLFATPWTAAYQAPPSMGFSRQEYWSELPFPSPMHESEKWKWSRSVVSDSSRPHGLQPTRLLRPWDFPGKSAGVGCHCLLQGNVWENVKFSISILGIVWMLKPLSCFFWVYAQKWNC